MGSWIPLSRLCLCGVVATPDQQGRWCWIIEGRQWRYNQQTGLGVEIFDLGRWIERANVGTLNHAIAFSLGWQAHADSESERAVAELDKGPSPLSEKAGQAGE